MCTVVQLHNQGLPRIGGPVEGWSVFEVPTMPRQDRVRPSPAPSCLRRGLEKVVRCFRRVHSRAALPRRFSCVTAG
jgi:hypothetical protein